MRKFEGRLSSVWKLAVCSVLVCGGWEQSTRADEVLTLTGDNPNVGFIDDVAPAQTWQILANSNGYAVRDITGTTLTPLLIEPGAPTDAFRIEATGDVGIGLSAFEDLDIFSGNSDLD